MTDLPSSNLPEQPDGVILFEAADQGAITTVASAWCPLDERALLRVAGADAEAFLQGQLTQDMSRLAEDHVLFAAHCTPKGRITALFRAWKQADAFLLDAPAALAGAAQRRLGMYVLRAKVQVSSIAADWERTGVAGEALGTVLDGLGYPRPESVGQLRRSGDLCCLKVGPARWIAMAPALADGGLRARLAQQAAAAPAAWALAGLRDGDPEVAPETVEAFVPQMLNLDLLDGINFKKGCYTGQEIVARTHYLGRVKRRMRRFTYQGEAPPRPGTLVPIGGAGEAAQAEIVIALQTHAGGGEALAVAAVAAEP
jgi:folate-binding protein YgfZ